MKNAVFAGIFLAAAVPAQAGIVYSNNFDGENGGSTVLNYNSFSGLNVTDGTVDLVHTNDGYGIVCAGGPGGCVDLDGSSSDAGVLNSTGSFAFAAGDTVTLFFSISGNQRGRDPDNWRAEFDFAAGVGFTNYGYAVNGGSPLNLGAVGSTTFYALSNASVAADAGFTRYAQFFTAATAGTLTFKIFNNGTDNVGPILDDVALDITGPAVPEPASWAMMIGGFAVAGAAMRRRVRAPQFA